MKRFTTTLFVLVSTSIIAQNDFYYHSKSNFHSTDNDGALPVMRTFSPKENEVYKITNTISANLFSTNKCIDDSEFLICQNSEIRITYVSDDKTQIVVRLDKIYNCTDSLDDKRRAKFLSYCVDPTMFNSANMELVKGVSFNIGLVTFAVPLKFDLRSYKVYPGGEIAVAPALRLIFDGSGSSITATPFIGFSRIPLNDVNSQSETDLKTVTGVSLGFGFGFSFPNGVQMGAYCGWDHYNSEGIKNISRWVSFGVGYEFLQYYDKKKETKVN